MPGFFLLKQRCRSVCSYAFTSLTTNGRCRSSSSGSYRHRHPGSSSSFSPVHSTASNAHPSHVPDSFPLQRARRMLQEGRRFHQWCQHTGGVRRQERVEWVRQRLPWCESTSSLSNGVPMEEKKEWEKEKCEPPPQSWDVRAMRMEHLIAPLSRGPNTDVASSTRIPWRDTLPPSTTKEQAGDELDQARRALDLLQEEEREKASRFIKYHTHRLLVTWKQQSRRWSAPHRPLGSSSVVADREGEGKGREKRNKKSGIGEEERTRKEREIQGKWEGMRNVDRLGFQRSASSSVSSSSSASAAGGTVLSLEQRGEVVRYLYYASLLLHVSALYDAAEDHVERLLSVILSASIFLSQHLMPLLRYRNEAAAMTVRSPSFTRRHSRSPSFRDGTPQAKWGTSAVSHGRDSHRRHQEEKRTSREPTTTQESVLQDRIFPLFPSPSHWSFLRAAISHYGAGVTLWELVHHQSSLLFGKASAPLVDRHSSPGAAPPLASSPRNSNGRGGGIEDPVRATFLYHAHGLPFLHLLRLTSFLLSTSYPRMAQDGLEHNKRNGGPPHHSSLLLEQEEEEAARQQQMWLPPVKEGIQGATSPQPLRCFLASMTRSLHQLHRKGASWNERHAGLHWFGWDPSSTSTAAPCTTPDTKGGEEDLIQQRSFSCKEVPKAVKEPHSEAMFFSSSSFSPLLPTPTSRDTWRLPCAGGGRASGALQGAQQRQLQLLPLFWLSLLYHAVPSLETVKGCHPPRWREWTPHARVDSFSDVDLVSHSLASRAGAVGEASLAGIEHPPRTHSEKRKEEEMKNKEEEERTGVGLLSRPSLRAAYGEVLSLYTKEAGLEVLSLRLLHLLFDPNKKTSHQSCPSLISCSSSSVLLIEVMQTIGIMERQGLLTLPFSLVPSTEPNCTSMTNFLNTYKWSTNSCAALSHRSSLDEDEPSQCKGKEVITTHVIEFFQRWLIQWKATCVWEDEPHWPCPSPRHRPHDTGKSSMKANQMQQWKEKEDGRTGRGEGRDESEAPTACQPSLSSLRTPRTTFSGDADHHATGVASDDLRVSALQRNAEGWLNEIHAQRLLPWLVYRGEQYLAWKYIPLSLLSCLFGMDGTPDGPHAKAGEKHDRDLTLTRKEWASSSSKRHSFFTPSPVTDEDEIIVVPHAATKHVEEAAEEDRSPAVTSLPAVPMAWPAAAFAFSFAMDTLREVYAPLATCDVPSPRPYVTAMDRCTREETIAVVALDLQVLRILVLRVLLQWRPPCCESPLFACFASSSSRAAGESTVTHGKLPDIEKDPHTTFASSLSAVAVPHSTAVLLFQAGIQEELVLLLECAHQLHRIWWMINTTQMKKKRIRGHVKKEEDAKFMQRVVQVTTRSCLSVLTTAMRVLAMQVAGLLDLYADALPSTSYMVEDASCATIRARRKETEETEGKRVESPSSPPPQQQQRGSTANAMPTSLFSSSSAFLHRVAYRLTEMDWIALHTFHVLLCEVLYTDILSEKQRTTGMGPLPSTSLSTSTTTPPSPLSAQFSVALDTSLPTMGPRLHIRERQQGEDEEDGDHPKRTLLSRGKLHVKGEGEENGQEAGIRKEKMKNMRRTSGNEERTRLLSLPLLYVEIVVPLLKWKEARQEERTMK